MRSPYFTLKEAIYYEAESIKGSRFFVNACPVTSEDAAKQAVHLAQSQFPNARHHCWALSLRSPPLLRPHDDGEPSGSAGKPILSQLQGHQLQDVILIVSRFFGGTKLGVGGLVRAYGGAASQALAQAEIIQLTPKTSFSLSFPYADTALVDSALNTLSIIPIRAYYNIEVTLEIEIPDAEVDTFSAAFNELTAQRIKVIKLSP